MQKSRCIFSLRETYLVYLLARQRNGTLYIGVTNHLIRRVDEQHDHIEPAIEREKRLKKWNRKRKLALIEKDNPGWKDLSEELG